MDRNKHYDKARHKAWSEKVQRRAGYLCEECRRYGRTDKDGNPIASKIAHHKKPVREFPELAYDVRNGQALCLRCHSQKHPEKGGFHAGMGQAGAYGRRGSPPARGL